MAVVKNEIQSSFWHIYVSMIVDWWTSKYSKIAQQGKTKDNIQVGESKAEIQTDTRRSKKWDQDVGQKETGIQWAVGLSGSDVVVAVSW